MMMIMMKSTIPPFTQFGTDMQNRKSKKLLTSESVRSN